MAPEYASLSYVTIDMIADRVESLGRGTWLTKLDSKSAFLIIPIHPVDRILLGMQWKGSLYVDTVLPFGLRSAPKLFNVIADAVQYIARSQGVQHITHYLDDYIILGGPGLEKCGTDLRTLIELCHCLGVPLADEKIEGPATELEILGIKIDSVAMQLSLPEHKMQELKALLRDWQGRKPATKKEMQLLAGKLQNAAKVVRPGRCFVRHIYDLTSVRGGQNQRVSLNQQIRSDIQWWLTFMDAWNGISLFWKSRCSTPDIQVQSDASGSWGCGALTKDKWLSFPWPDPLQELSIAHKGR